MSFCLAVLSMSPRPRGIKSYSWFLGNGGVPPPARGGIEGGRPQGDRRGASAWVPAHQLGSRSLSLSKTARSALETHFRLPEFCGSNAPIDVTGADYDARKFML